MVIYVFFTYGGDVITPKNRTNSMAPVEQSNPFNALATLMAFVFLMGWGGPGWAANPTSDSAASESRVTYDLGLATGSYNSLNYTEAQLGLNYYFSDYFAWRNAGFYRFQTGMDNTMGIDTSLRGLFSLGGQPLGFSAFAGPGFRFVNRGDNAPFIEAGAAIKVAGFAVGAGVKSIFNNSVNPKSPNDTQIMILLSGAGSL
jgi:hypothetical protein